MDEEKSISTETCQTTDIDYLKEIYDMTRKQLMWQRITSCAIAGIFIALLVSVYIMIPKMITTLANIDRVTSEAMESIQDIDVMVAEMTDASSNLNKLVSDNADTLTQAVNDLAGIDFDGLNAAIKDLQDTVAPFAAFFRKFQ